MRFRYSAFRLALLAGVFLALRSEWEPRSLVPVPVRVVRVQRLLPPSAPGAKPSDLSQPATAEGPVEPTSPVPNPPQVPIPWVPARIFLGASGGGLTQIREKVRSEVGLSLSPLDLTLDRVDLLGLHFPTWLKANLGGNLSDGYDINLGLFLRWHEWKVAVSLWNHENGTGTYPGADFQVFEYPILLSRTQILVSPRYSCWAAPPVSGAGTLAWAYLGSVTFEVPLDENLWLWFEGKGETQPQALGQAGPELTFRTGLHWSL